MYLHVNKKHKNNILKHEHNTTQVKSIRNTSPVTAYKSVQLNQTLISPIKSVQSKHHVY